MFAEITRQNYYSLCPTKTLGNNHGNRYNHPHQTTPHTLSYHTQILYLCPTTDRPPVLLSGPINCAYTSPQHYSQTLSS